MRLLITSGGTKIPIDSVRHIGNMSSGTFGSKIGYEALRAGHDVTFLMAAGSKSPLGLRFDENISIKRVLWKTMKNVIDRIRFRKRIHLVTYTDFHNYESQLWRFTCERPDAVVLAAAVSDYDVVNKVEGKIRTKGNMTICLTPLPKLISRFKEGSDYPRPRVLVGFKLLVGATVGELVFAAKESLVNNGCDLVVANDLQDIKASNHTLRLVSKGQIRTLYSDPKDPNILARHLVKEIEWLHKQKG